MIDFHTHVLPGIDDGADKLATSIEMLRECAKNGIDTVVCSSHCYPQNSEYVSKYIHKSEAAFKRLSDAVAECEGEFPTLVRGCEVTLMTDIAGFDGLEKLCIGNTKYIMIEMPFGRWEDWMYESLYSIIVRGLRPVIAHIDRYSDMKKNMVNLFDLDLIYQINTDAFLTTSLRKFAADLMKSGHGHILGSDIHNLADRNTNYAKAVSIINDKLGSEYVEYTDINGRALLKNEHIQRNAHRKLPPLKTMFKLFG